MRDYMTALIECSVTMSVLVLGFMAITPWLSKKYSAKWLYYVWVVLVVGLIIPFRVHPDTAFIRMNAAPSYIQQIVSGNAGNVVDLTISTSTAPQGLPAISWYQIGISLWIAGVFAFIVYHGLKHYRFIKMVNRWGEQPDAQMLDTLQRIKTDMGIIKPVKLRICSCISSPMMIGFLSPVILLPRPDFSANELPYILRHELVHFKRKDLWYKSLVLLATAIHWFNPVIYLMAKAIASQCEVSCDAEVVNETDLDTRQRYSETIIGVIKNQSRIQTAFSTNFYGGKKGMKKRIFSIMDTSKKKTGVVILCLVLAGTLGTGAAFAANSPAVPETQTTYIASSGDEHSQAVSNTPTEQELLSEYGSYGISFDKDGKIHFNGELVRYFWDGADLGDNTAVVRYEYLNEEGTVDVHTTWKSIDNGDGSIDPLGELTGIEKYNQTEFEQRNLADLKGTSDAVTYATGDGSVSEGETFAQKFAKYKDFGIEYKEQQGSGRGNVYYNGQLVKTFVDEKKDGGVFSYQSVDGGEISVHTIYDENGKLIGVEKGKS
ncbi:MAG TPA: M56 family metallopeptidase [Mobilitalea sp.]|nr:M56 family metallopeptidase [Mobilitalea sp.]